MKKTTLALATMMIMSTAAMAQNEGNGQRPEVDRTEMIKQQTDQMVKDYGLNQEQAEQLLKLNTEYSGKIFMGGMRGGRGGGQRPGGGGGFGQRPNGGGNAPQMGNGERPSREQMEARMKEMRENQEAYTGELKKIFTEAQYKKYEKAQRQRMERMQQRSQGGFGGGGFGGGMPMGGGGFGGGGF
ncbi:MAG: DUF4890 domain-containing protein [Prevotella sp.]|nr:DUF4890 domain-containing protein [Prevotella sp.]